MEFEFNNDKVVMNLTLFRATTYEKFCDLKDHNYISSISNNEVDLNWLGKGIYFWENYGNAEEWKKNHRYNTIMSLNLSITDKDKEAHFLDLTDIRTLNMLNNIRKGLYKSFIESITNKEKKEYKKVMGEPILYVNEMYYLDNNLNYFDLFEFVCLKLNCEVVKVIGHYPKRKLDPFFISRRFKSKNSNHMTNCSKVIYCIKNNFEKYIKEISEYSE